MRKLRADKRSFSFTWMRGQNGQNKMGGGIGFENPASTSDITETTHHPQMGRSNTTWYMTTASTSSSSSGVSSMSESSTSMSSISSKPGESEKQGSSGLSRNDSNSSMKKLRKLGNSFTRFGTKYSIIEDDDENAMQEENMETAPAAPQVAAVPAAATPSTPMAALNLKEPASVTSEVKKQRMHFDEDGNFVGRHEGRPGSSRRKSGISGKEAGTSTSFGRKINKTVQDVKASIGSFSQRFRRSTRRRYRMGPGTPLTEITPTRRILGRTPTKLYSPFGIAFESPALKTPKRLDRPSTPRLTRRSMVSGLVYSPANNFGNDLADARRGMEDFHILTRDITRRSVRF